MSPSSNDLVRQSLQAQHDMARRQYQALTEQLLVENNPATRVQLQSAADAKLAEITRLEQQLSQLGTTAVSQTNAGSSGNPKETAAPPDPKVLRNALITHYDLNELRLLSEDLGVDFDNLGGNTKQIKALELVQYLQRRGHLAELVARVRDERPEAGM